MKNFFILLFFTLFALDVSAQFRPSQSQYFDIDNTFKNMGFEQGYDGWDLTTTCAKTIETVIPYLNKSLKLDCTAQDFDLSQTTTQLVGMKIKGLTSVIMKTSASGVSYKVFSNAVEISSLSIPVDTKLDRYEVSFDIDDTSNGASLTATSFTGIVVVDNLKLGIEPEGYSKTAVITTSPYLIASNNNGGVMTANVSNINWVESSDISNSWSGDTWTAPEDGIYQIEGASSAGSSAYYINAYVDGVLRKTVSQTGVTSGQKTISGIVLLNEGEALTLRSNATITLTTGTQFHHLVIKKL